MTQRLLFGIKGIYCEQTSRVDIYARKLADRHYSRKHVGTKDFIGPGRSFVLIGDKRVWGARICKYRLDGLAGIECCIFRNESTILSSLLINEAIKLTRIFFGNYPIFTYVNPKKIKSVNPGYCFKKAGFKQMSRTSKINKLILLINQNNENESLTTPPILSGT